MPSGPSENSKDSRFGLLNFRKSGKRSYFDTNSQKSNSKSFGHIETISNLLIKEAQFANKKVNLKPQLSPGPSSYDVLKDSQNISRN